MDNFKKFLMLLFTVNISLGCGNIVFHDKNQSHEVSKIEESKLFPVNKKVKENCKEINLLDKEMEKFSKEIDQLNKNSEELSHRPIIYEEYFSFIKKKNVSDISFEIAALFQLAVNGDYSKVSFEASRLKEKVGFLNLKKNEKGALNILLTVLENSVGNIRFRKNPLKYTKNKIRAAIREGVISGATSGLIVITALTIPTLIL